MQETCADAAVGFASLMIFMAVVFSSLVTPILIEKLGVSGCFGFYAICSFLGCIYLHTFFKDSTYKLVQNPDGSTSKVHLTEKEKKQLYMPEDLKE